MPLRTWLKSKAKEMREEREFKKGVEAEAHRIKKEAYRKSYRRRVLAQAKKQGQQHAKPRPSLLKTLEKSLPTSDFNLFGESTRKRTKHKRKK